MAAKYKTSSVIASKQDLQDFGSRELPRAPHGKDNYNLVFIVFMLNGIGTLLPWNTFINGRSYFMDYKLNTNETANADIRINFMNHLGLASHIPAMLMTILNCLYQPLTASKQSRDASKRISIVIVIEAAICSLTVALAVIDTSHIPKIFFLITMASVIALNCCSAIYQSSAFGMAAMLPMTYSNAVVLGNNICGTLIAIVNILCKAAAAQNLKYTAISYFSFAVFVLIVCLLSMLLLSRLPYYHHNQAIVQAISGNEYASQVLMGGDNRMIQKVGRDGSHGRSSERSQESGGQEAGSWFDDFMQTLKPCCGVCCAKNGKELCAKYWSRYWYAIKDCWMQCLNVWTVFFCTLSCFPAIQSEIRPVELTGMSDWFTDIFVFLFFNMFAMFGNMLSNFVQFPSPRWLSLVVWIRTLVFVPFFILCNCFPNHRPSSFPVLIPSDYPFIVGIVIFSFSHGYFSSLGMMYAPRVVKKSELAGLAAMVATSLLAFGIFSGISFGSFLFNIVNQQTG